MTTMTSKGQVTIPKRMRDALGLRPGHEVQFELEADGRVVIRPNARRRKSAIDKVRGTMKGKFTTHEIMRLTRGWS
jgi:AbrB family looped-hinge helix DNA binding protein